MDDLEIIFNILYLLAAIAVAIFAYLGLEQLKISKENTDVTRKNAQLSAKREAYSAAADQCRYYGDCIVPLINKLDEKVNENDVKLFDDCKIIFDNDDLSVEFPDNMEEESNKMDYYFSEYGELINALSTFSLYFTSGVAEEKVAFYDLGRSYCLTIEKICPLIVILSQKSHEYQNIYDLYIIWKNRLEIMELQEKQDDIESKIKSIPNRSISTIGTGK